MCGYYKDALNLEQIADPTPKHQATTLVNIDDMATLSSQSALWTILTLALNTLVQPVDKVFGSEGNLGRALRLSPIVCLAEVAFTLLAMSHFWRKTHSLAQSCRLTARMRVPGDARNGNRPSFRQKWWFRPLLFAFGALPQAVKLFAVQGAPLTQVWGAAYLMSFWLREAVSPVGLPESDSDTERDQINEKKTMNQSESDKIPPTEGFSVDDACILRQYEQSHYAVMGRHLQSFAMFAQICFLIWEIGAGLSDSTFSAGYSGTDHRYHNLQLTGIGRMAMVPVAGFATGIMAAGAALVYLPIIHMSEGRHIHVRLRSILAPFSGDYVEGCVLALTGLLRVGLIITSFFAFVWYREYLDHHTDSCIRWAAAVMILLFASILFVIGFRFISGLGFIRLCMGLRIGEPTLVPWFFATASFVAILIYFIELYDSTNTYKPRWTQFLG